MAETVVAPDDLYVMLVGQLRYSLGRRSYIVGTTCDLVRRYARDLTPSQRETLLIDLRRHVEESPALDNGPSAEPRDIRERWFGLLADMEAGRV